jgi:valyl-tRNA synthetase
MSQLQEIIAAARNLRAELKLDPRKPIAADFFVADTKLRALVEANIAAVRQFAALSSLNFVAARLNPADGPLRSTSEFDLRIPYETVTDVASELVSLRKEQLRLEGIIAGQRKQLANPAFSGKAPAAVITKLQESLAERKSEYGKITQRISQLDGTARGTSPA